MKLPGFNFKIFTFSFLSLFVFFSLQAGTQNPNILSIPAYEYKAGKKNWGFAFDSKGKIYIANNDGMLVYDGLQWVFINSGSIIRSVAVDKNDCIYTGGYKQFGVWKKDQRGILCYSSLSESVLKDMDPDEEIWRIIVRKEGIYFQSFAHIYFYDYDRVTTLPSVGFILLLQNTEDQLLIEGFGQVYEVNKTSIRPVFNTPVELIHAILPSDDGLLLCSSKNGIWKESGGNVTPWNKDLNVKLKDADINCALVLPNGHFMIGTLSKGIFELTQQGEIVRHYTIQSGLQSNTVLSMMLDRNRNVWVGTDNGISKLEYDNRFHFVRDKNGELGAVHATALSNKNLYIGTNKGLFKIDYSRLSLQNVLEYIEPISGAQGLVWTLSEIHSRLYMGHHKGLFLIEENRLIPLYTSNGVQSVKEFTQDKKNFLLASSYNKLLLLKENETTGRFELLRELKGNINVATSIELDHQGNIWLGHEFKGYSCYRLDKEMTELIQLPVKLSKDIHLANSFVKVSALNGRIVLLSGGVAYTYDDLNQQIIPFDLLNNDHKIVTSPQLLQSVDNYKYWLIGKNEWALLDVRNNDLKVLDRLRFNDPSIETVDGYETVFALNDSVSIINLMNGFLVYQSGKSNGNISYLSSPLSLSFIEAYSSGGKRDTLNNQNDKEPVLSSDLNNLKFRISGCALQNMQNSYQYKLEGMDRNWSEIKNDGEIQFDRLPFGKYTLLIRSVNRQGISGDQASSCDIVYRFEILPPWYFRWYFIGVYIISILTIILTVRKIYAIKHEKQLARQSELEEQMRIIQEKQKLESVLHEKNSKLVEITSTTIKKNELLHNVKEEIEAFVSKNPSTTISNRLSKISRTINSPALVKDDWSMFVMQFEASHPHFFRDIKLQYPNLTPSELKLAACLKLNLTTKDIASLLNISVRGVEVSRYRLRKKINLSSSDNLNEFFIRNF